MYSEPPVNIRAMAGIAASIIFGEIKPKPWLL